MYEFSLPLVNPELYGVSPSGFRALQDPGQPPCLGMGCYGMGGLTMDGSGLFGTGIFGTGVTLTDLSTWGVGEYVTVALGIFVVASVLSSGKRAASKVSRRVKSISRIPQRRRQARAERLRQEAAQLEAA